MRRIADLKFSAHLFLSPLALFNGQTLQLLRSLLTDPFSFPYRFRIFLWKFAEIFLEKNHFFTMIQGREIKTFLEDEPIDVVSGATITSKAVLQAIKTAYSKGEELSLPDINYPRFGLPELIVLFLLFTGLVIVKIRTGKAKKTLLWVSSVVSVIILGFIYNQHLTLSRISGLLSGYFPSYLDEL